MRTTDNARRTRAGARNPRTPEAMLHALRIEHDDLDAAIMALLKSGLCDDLLITRLKKRKLQIKDAIAGLREQGPPDRVAQAS